MEAITKRPKGLTDVKMHYCPGCGHGVVHRLIAEVLEELNIVGKTIGVAPVGCAVFADTYFACDMIQGPHGRGPAIATGLKRSKPELTVFSYQGDGDLASIGMAETIHSAARSENITVIFINNGIYGMTGGQMAPTTLVGQKSTTSPKGRNALTQGYPIKVCELLSTLHGAKYLERCAVHKPQLVIKAKQAIKKAFQNQLDGKGFSMVELLTICPTNWGLNPKDSISFLEKQMEEYYPLGVYKDEQ